jgi:hypothetical protein
MIWNEKIKPRSVPVTAYSPPIMPFVLQAAGFSEQVPAFVWDPRVLDLQLAYVIITLEWDYSESMEK